jgi:hypothetical protein
MITFAWVRHRAKRIAELRFRWSADCGGRPRTDLYSLQLQPELQPDAQSWRPTPAGSSAVKSRSAGAMIGRGQVRCPCVHLTPVPRSSDQVSHDGEHPHRGQIGDDLHPAADHAGMHGVGGRGDRRGAHCPVGAPPARRHLFMPSWRSSSGNPAPTAVTKVRVIDVSSTRRRRSCGCGSPRSRTPTGPPSSAARPPAASPSNRPTVEPSSGDRRSSHSLYSGGFGSTARPKVDALTPARHAYQATAAVTRPR